MKLAEYKKKRHFDVTPEPGPKVAPVKGWSYVIQKHAASHLHYDFRLEFEGVLKSWAVPKGPSLDPSVKRLAMAVEDHPVDYGGFEGIIPQGQYGGGTVMLWDRGSWEPVGSATEGFRKGHLKFILHGEKLQGAWNLVRTHSSEPSKHNQWLLFKSDDNEAWKSKKADIVDSAPLSVVSGRSLDEIAASKDRVWNSNAGTQTQSKKATPLAKSIAKESVAKTNGKATASAKPVVGAKRAMPTRIDVQLATLTKDAPPGDAWLHEIKFDGYRMICRIDGKHVTFLSRNHLDWTQRLPTLVEAAHQLPVKQAIIDGEIVAVTKEGITDFQALQNAFREGRERELQYYAFDLLYLNGRSLVALPLEERKAELQKLLAEGKSAIHYSDHVIGQGDKVHKEACKLHLEGSISKLRDQPYKPGRGYNWLKVKCVNQDEFVIGGFTEPSGSRVGLGALLMGFYDPDHNLHYAGKVGTGMDDETLVTLQQRFQKLEQAKSPFIDRVSKTGDIKTAHWLRPSLVAQIKYGSRTREGILRHAVFTGLREDKPAGDVKLDQAIPVTTAVKRASKEKTKAKPASKSAPKSTPKAASKSAGTRSRTSKAAVPAAPEYDSASETFAGVRLTHPDKVLYPEAGITKLDLAAYYQSVAKWMLPHILHRPLVLVRCPDGQAKECFYQKHPSAGTPDILRQIPIQESKKTENYVVVDNVDGLIALAQIGALEIHAWGSREDKLEQPDRLVFDLDPNPDVPWKQVVNGARQIRQFLKDVGLESFLKTTGGKGLHLVVPIDRRHEWDEAKAFCKAVADAVVSVAPDQYTSNMSKAARTKKIFLDYLRNGRGATAVVPYSPRSRPGATVSMPITWDELDDNLHSDDFTIRNCQDRLSRLRKDPWAGIADVRQSLTPAIKALKKLGVLN